MERHVKRADAFFEKGEHEKARIEYLNAFQLGRNDPHVASRLGELFLAAGDAPRAFQLLSHAKLLQGDARAALREAESPASEHIAYAARIRGRAARFGFSGAKADADR